MKRTKLKDRQLPDYTRGEEIFNMVSHIVGGAFGIAALATCVVKAFLNHDAYEIVSAFIYGFSMVILYTVSSVYHGLIPKTAKKVMQVIDHCTVFILIAGTYTPVSLCSLRRASTPLGWTVFGIVWGVTALGITLNAVDLKKFRVFSMICYMGMGWCIIFAVVPTYHALGLGGFLLLVAGGLLYTFGAILYGLGIKHRYMHSVFHIFVILGSLAHFFCIVLYVL